MELDKLVTQDNEDNGVWTPVELYGKPADFDLLILGDDSDVVIQHGRKSLKKMKGALAKEKEKKSEEYDDETLDAVDGVDESVLVHIAGIRGWKRERDKKGSVLKQSEEAVTLNGKELGNDKESYKLLITKIPAVKEFVLKVARDRTNFLSQPSGN
jgi:hypothetical protein